MKPSFRVLRTMFQSRFSLIWLLLAMVVGFSLTSGAFRTPENLLEILQSSGITAILVLGLTWIVAIGEMDISFADVAALVSMITAYLAVKRDLPIGLALLLAFLGGSLIGVINGFMTAYMKIPSLIGTTAMGQHLYALGENRQAAREAGIKEPRIIFYYFILCSVLASIAGILSTALLGSGVSEIGGGTLTIQGFTAVFLGVMVVKAGKPNVIGTLIGVIMLTVLMNWITLLGQRTFIVWLARGSLLLIGVMIVTLSSYQRKVYKTQIR